MQERQIMNHEDVRRALARVAHEILERNRGAEGLVIVGIHTRGVHLARRIAANLAMQGKNYSAAFPNIVIKND